MTDQNNWYYVRAGLKHSCMGADSNKTFMYSPKGVNQKIISHQLTYQITTEH